MGVSIIADLIEVLNLVETTYTELAPLVPLIEKVINGTALTDADAVTVITVRKAVEAQAALAGAPPAASA